MAALPMIGLTLGYCRILGGLGPHGLGVEYLAHLERCSTAERQLVVQFWRSTRICRPLGDALPPP
jgi:hypothetical protein